MIKLVCVALLAVALLAVTWDRKNRLVGEGLNPLWFWAILAAIAVALIH